MSATVERLMHACMQIANYAWRPARRWVIDHTFELFMDLGANDDQCDFPVIYASGFQVIGIV